MRIARLDLTRYGKFSDHRLDFGPAPAGGSDFHIVYGLNETGKSTAAAAILDLLFGIEKHSAYGAAKGRVSVPNWHGYNAMRIGARIELGGRPYEMARLKRDRNSLVDADGRPFDENILTAELAGVDRDAFHMMFSLDDESLEKGGEAILASRGDLGQLLFAASAGLAEISDRLELLRRKADEFYRPRASTTELAELKRELEAIKHERDEADTLAPAYAELVRQRDAARDAYAAAAKSLSERRVREDEIQRQLGALPHLVALREAESRTRPSKLCRRLRKGGATRFSGCRRKRSDWLCRKRMRNARSERLRTRRSASIRIRRRSGLRVGSRRGGRCAAVTTAPPTFLCARANSPPGAKSLRTSCAGSAAKARPSRAGFRFRRRSWARSTI